MSDLEFLGSLTIGQYVPSGSRLHGLHPAAKLAAAALLLAALVACSSLVALAASLGLLLALIRASGVGVRYGLRGVRAAGPLLALIALLQVVAVPRNDTGALLLRLWVVRITTGDLLAAARMLLKFGCLILLIGLATFVTATRELVHGTEILLAPLSRIGLPGDELALTLTVALRFLPILAQEAEHIAKAQVSRGADLGRGARGVVRRVRLLLPLLVPLFLAALGRAERLAVAMEARCYTGGRGRTRLARYRFGARDSLALGASIGWTAALVLSTVMGIDARLWALVLRITG